MAARLLFLSVSAKGMNCKEEAATNPAADGEDPIALGEKGKDWGGGREADAWNDEHNIVGEKERKKAATEQQ